MGAFDQRGQTVGTQINVDPSLEQRLVALQLAGQRLYNQLMSHYLSDDQYAAVEAFSEVLDASRMPPPQGAGGRDRGGTAWLN